MLSETSISIKDSNLIPVDIKQYLDGSGKIVNSSLLLDEKGNPISSTNGLTIKNSIDSSQSYQFSLKIVPTVLANNSVYAVVRNAGTENIYIEYLNIKQVFNGTPATTSSDYDIVSFTNGTGASGGTAVIIGKRKSTNSSPGIDVRFSNGAGIVVTGAVISTSRLTVGHPNQNTANNDFELNLKDSPMILATNEGVILRASSAIVGGSTLYITCLFKQMP